MQLPPNCEFCGESCENQEMLSRHLRTKHRDKVKLTILEHPERPKGGDPSGTSG